MSKIIDSLIGHALGDAMGTPIEFFNRKYLQENKVKEMLGNIGQHKEPIGSWSDDTSMELATIDSIINKNTNNYYRNELFRNIDFGIFTSDYNEILLLIEINDKTHNNKKRIKRDKKVDYITANAGIRLIKFYSNYDNKREYIKERVKNEILKERDKLNISNK